MTARYWLLLALLFIHLAVAVWDIWCVSHHRPDDTVSATFLAWASHYPIFAFMFGVLVGHVFWPQERLMR